MKKRPTTAAMTRIIIMVCRFIEVDFDAAKLQNLSQNPYYFIRKSAEKGKIGLKSVIFG